MREWKTVLQKTSHETVRSTMAIKTVTQEEIVSLTLNVCGIPKIGSFSSDTSCLQQTVFS